MIVQYYIHCLGKYFLKNVKLVMKTPSIKFKKQKLLESNFYNGSFL